MELDKKESEIIKGCIEGNRLSQKELYELHARKVLGICIRYLKDVDEAQDAMQETFIKAFEKLGTFRGDCPIKGWLRRIAVNVSISKIRDRKRILREGFLSEYREENIVEEDEDLDNISTEKLLQAIHSLPEGYRTVFNLRVVDEYSHEEIANALGIKEGTSKSQYSKAKSQLKKILLKDVSSQPVV